MMDEVWQLTGVRWLTVGGKRRSMAGTGGVCVKRRRIATTMATLDAVLLTLDIVAAILVIAAAVRWTLSNPQAVHFSTPILVGFFVASLAGFLTMLIGSNLRMTVVAEVGTLAWLLSIAAFTVTATRLQSKR